MISQYAGDTRTVIADNGSSFYDFLGCNDNNTSGQAVCNGTATQYVDDFFGGLYNEDNMVQDILVCALFLVSARVLTFFALKKFNYTNA